MADSKWSTRASPASMAGQALCTAILALALAGCTGQTMEGAWRGPMPFAGAEDCRVRLFHDRTFDLACQDPQPGSGAGPWNGVGRWSREATRLKLSFVSVGRGEERVTEPPELEFAFVGRGNTLDLEQIPGGATFRWVRRME